MHSRLSLACGGNLRRSLGRRFILQAYQDIQIGARMPAVRNFNTPWKAKISASWKTGRRRSLPRCGKLPGLRDLSSDQQDRGLQATLVVDRDTASGSEFLSK